MKTNSTSIDIESRRPVQLHNVTETGSTTGSAKSGQTQIWFDLRKAASGEDVSSLLQRLPNLSYSGIVVGAEHLGIIHRIPPKLRIVFHANAIEDLTEIGRIPEPIILSKDPEVLAKARELGLPTCLHQYVDDGESLHRSIYLGKQHSHLMIHFRDPTNIPLELVIASLQFTNTVLLKEIADIDDVDDAVVSLGVMEVGADGVVFSPRNQAKLDEFQSKLMKSRQEKLPLEEASILQSIPIGMGFRSCLDLATLFNPNEGMVVGSTSQGGILCCPEVFYLPYMETRPFRVNAGGVHSYVYNSGNRTDYMSELRGGSQVLVIGLDGQTRTAAIGRVKTEMRPLRLIEAQFAGGEKINVILQDDWHVRVFSNTGEPLNVTELKPGDKVRALKAIPGRHVGIKVEERILEM